MGDVDRHVFQDRRRAESFGSEAELYDKTRPSYPSELIAWLSTPRVGTAIDVGCGTGQVARLLDAAGWRVTGVEIDERMADVARSHGVDVVVSPFEQWEPERTVDLVCSGQAWHWIDPEVGYRHAAHLLRPGGRLALFWNSYGYDAATTAVFGEVVARHAPRLLLDSVPFGTSSPDHAELDAAMVRRSAQWFAEPEFLVFGHGRSLSVGQWRAELLTHSPVALLAEEVRTSLLGELGEVLADLNQGQVRIDYETRVTSALRR